MIVRRLARPLLAAIFISGGLAALRDPQSHKEAAEPVVNTLADPLGLPRDTEMMVRANGAAMVLGGALLALGKMPRVSSLLLTGALAPTTATHNFWAQTDPGAKADQRVQFLKNLGLLGGLLLAAVDTEGKPGLGYRAKMAGDSIGRSTRAAKREAKIAALQAKNAVS